MRPRIQPTTLLLETRSRLRDRLEFDNTGPNQVPGLIVMSLRGRDRIEFVVLFNATTVAQEFPLDTGQPGGFAAS